MFCHFGQKCCQRLLSVGKIRGSGKKVEFSPPTQNYYFFPSVAEALIQANGFHLENKAN